MRKCRSGMHRAGSVVRYACVPCRRSLVTIVRRHGRVPDAMLCFRCAANMPQIRGGRATRATHEWFSPCEALRLFLSEWTFHFLCHNGLILRRIEQ